MARVEQEARARFDHRPHFMLIQQASEPLEAVGKLHGEWVERTIVERDRDAAIADVRQDFDGGERIVMSKAVRVVTKKHCKFRQAVGAMGKLRLPVVRGNVSAHERAV